MPPYNPAAYYQQPYGPQQPQPWGGVDQQQMDALLQYLAQNQNALGQVLKGQTAAPAAPVPEPAQPSAGYSPLNTLGNVGTSLGMAAMGGADITDPRVLGSNTFSTIGGELGKSAATSIANKIGSGLGAGGGGVAGALAGSGAGATGAALTLPTAAGISSALGGLGGGLGGAASGLAGAAGGAASGAAAGATAGSAVPVVGTVIGAGLGAAFGDKLGGLFGGDEEEEQKKEERRRAYRQFAAQATANTQRYGQERRAAIDNITAYLSAGNQARAGRII